MDEEDDDGVNFLVWQQGLTVGNFSKIKKKMEEEEDHKELE